MNEEFSEIIIDISIAIIAFYIFMFIGFLGAEMHGIKILYP